MLGFEFEVSLDTTRSVGSGGYSGYSTSVNNSARSEERPAQRRGSSGSAAASPWSAADSSSSSSRRQRLQQLWSTPAAAARGRRRPLRRPQHAPSDASAAMDAMAADVVSENSPAAFSDAQMRVLDVSTRVTAIVSLVASCGVLASWGLFPRLRTFSFHLVTMLALADCGADASYLMGGAGAKEAGALCTAQATLMAFFQFAVVLWTSTIAHALYAIARGGGGERADAGSGGARRALLWYHAYAWGASLVMAVLPLVYDAIFDESVYGPTGAWCWIGDNNQAWRFLFFICLWLVILAEVAAYVVVYRRVAAVAHAAAGAQAALTPTAKRRDADMRRFLRSLILYPAILMLSFGRIGTAAAERVRRIGAAFAAARRARWTSATANRIYEAVAGDELFGLLLAQIMTIRLQGLLNALAYGLTPAVRREWRAAAGARCCCRCCGGGAPRDGGGGGSDGGDDECDASPLAQRASLRRSFTRAGAWVQRHSFAQFGGARDAIIGGSGGGGGSGWFRRHSVPGDGSSGGGGATATAAAAASSSAQRVWFQRSTEGHAHSMASGEQKAAAVPQATAVTVLSNNDSTPRPTPLPPSSARLMWPSVSSASNGNARSSSMSSSATTAAAAAAVAGSPRGLPPPPQLRSSHSAYSDGSDAAPLT
ncbi:hypothetical protein JKP88DRAFT_289270 [Tribonema minus]|uniref:G-protein coupled receptors family 2 profile 2 domain-containing protein n=1 Tax=Tribonema minus TaxID=303371 RepID=A0A835Z4D4_9STRA|nr:hypothetical protein JKP88DRAFT_289270 [Tribonema minus]